MDAYDHTHTQVARIPEQRPRFDTARSLHWSGRGARPAQSGLQGENIRISLVENRRQHTEKSGRSSEKDTNRRPRPGRLDRHSRAKHHQMLCELFFFMNIFSWLYRLCFTLLHGGSKPDDRKEALFTGRARAGARRCASAGPPPPVLQGRGTGEWNEGTARGEGEGGGGCRALPALPLPHLPPFRHPHPHPHRHRHPHLAWATEVRLVWKGCRQRWRAA